MSPDYEEDFYSDENLSKIKDIQMNIGDDIPTYTDNNPAENISAGDISVESEASEDEETIEEPISYSLSLNDLGGIEVEDSDETEVFSPEERLKKFADDLLSNCLGDKPLSKYALERLFTLSNTKVFKDENYVIFSVLYQFKSKVHSIDIDEEFLKLYLNRNRKLLQDAKGLIDINAYGEVDGSTELGYIGGVLKHYRRLLTLPELSQVEFNTLFEKYLIEYKAIEAEKVYSRAQTILSDGMKLGRRNYSGFDDSYSYVRRKLAEIEGLGNEDVGTGFKTAREMLLEEKQEIKSYKISDFDKLEALNEVYGGIYTGMFYQVIAPPKAGKSKLMARVAHTTAIKYGNNVSVWAVEGGNDNFLAEIRAIHFDYTYNTGVSVTDKKYGVNQDAIAHDKFPSEELKQLELSSKLDLASNQSYGSVDFIDRPFNVESFIDDIETSVKSNNSKLLIIDYLQMIGSEKGKSEREAVSEAYKKLLKYCRQRNIAVMTPGQYKQSSIEALISKGNTADAEMRTSGGSSSEVIRTPDIIFSIWASTQDLLNNSMKILSVPCRFNKPFPEINVMVDLGVSQFISV